MKIADLSAPVRACKADWLPGTTYLGFTPRDGSGDARAKCQSAVQRQSQGGYVVEYVTEKFDDPNSGFENDPRIVAERIEHGQRAGRFIAVHKLRPSARSLREIVGAVEYDFLQDMWASGAKRHRWSVAFPIVESWDIKGWPKARAVLGDKSYMRLFGHPSGLLRPINNEEAAALGVLTIVSRPAPNAIFAVEDEFEMAALSSVSKNVENLIDRDMKANALEGHTEERKTQIRRRAAWLADRFTRRRAKVGTLHCDACQFDPAESLSAKQYRLRSALDVHHRDPLAEGLRRTTEADFALLCPTCHRMEHMLLNQGDSFFRSTTASGRVPSRTAGA